MQYATLKEWLEQPGEANQWGLQVIIDALALGENIPARVVSLTALECLYDHIHDTYQYLTTTSDAHNNLSVETLQAEWLLFKIHCPDQSAFDVWVAEELARVRYGQNKAGVCASYRPSADVIHAISRWVLVTLPSNELPSEHLVRIELAAWEWLVVLWLYRLCRTSECLANKHEDAFGIPHFCVQLHPISLTIKRTVDGLSTEDELYLMQGPMVFGQSSLFAEQDYDTDIVYKIVGAFRRIVEYFLDGRNFSNTRFNKAIQAEPSLPQKNSERRSARLKIALEKILAFRLVPSLQLDAQCLRLMSFWGLSHTQRHDLILAYAGVTGELRLDMLYESDTVHNRQYPDLVFEAYHHRQDFYLALRQVIDDAPWLLSAVDYGAMLNIFPRTSASEEALREFAIKLGHSFLRVDQKTKLHEQKELLIFTEWLQSRMGTLSNGKPNGQVDGAQSQLNHYQRSAEQICQWIAESMRADLCMLFSYEASAGKNGRLVALNSYSRSSVPLACRQQMEQDMQDIATNPVKREQSISYRALENQSQHICYYYNKETGESVPEGENLYRSSATQAYTPPYRMVISTPIKFNNRLLGIIEISSSQPYRFRYNRQTALKRIASTLSPFLYQHEYLLALHEIQMGVLKFHRRANRGSERDLYNGICKAMSRLFLSDGASLWIRDVTETNEFYCKGVYNECLLPGGGKEIHYDINDVNFRTGKYLKTISESSSGIKEIAHENLNDGKNLEGHHQYLRSQDIASINIIPIPSSQEGECGAIASLNIYNRGASVRYDIAWLGIAQFISSHLSLIIGAVKAFETEELIQENIHTHELWHDIQVLTDKVSRIARSNNFLREKLDALSYFINTDWFKGQLDIGRMVGVIDQLEMDRILASSQHVRDISLRGKLIKNEVVQFMTEQINTLRHGIETGLFLPQKDMLFLKGIIKARISVLLNNKYQEDAEYQRVLLISGRHDVARFSKYAEETTEIDLMQLYNAIVIGSELRKNRGVYIDFMEGASRKTIKAAPYIMHTVLTNLLVNAVKYSVLGYPVGVALGQVEGGMTSLTVTNTGYSMDNPAEHKLVTAYEVRGSNSKRGGETGHGMGLFIVDQVWKHIVGGEFIFREMPLKNGKSKYIAELIFP
ncbi:sensor histidine kinase [Candidatus Thiothrix anitrata]|uniref:Histidine kinase/HSP90-like ATPase domain-containing protein n=1 Tax=Candidatus Thiothrix anitrata TaxID=2823902 RepID=A0ABX7X7S8_9GAMM|nr:ATP-binding protein [Candidatus Thiothrix anitrata]QTR51243.1 hypothetical protein J8380_06755 [Candidatus Thiothrix anitrata]